MDERIQIIISILMRMTDEDRLKVLNKFCCYCGCDDPSCRCWDDT